MAKSQSAARAKGKCMASQHTEEQALDGHLLRKIDDINVTRSYAAWLDSQSKAARGSANREETRYLKTGTQGD